jgi:hypothetical protein
MGFLTASIDSTTSASELIENLQSSVQQLYSLAEAAAASAEVAQVKYFLAAALF